MTAPAMTTPAADTLAADDLAAQAAPLPVRTRRSVDVKDIPLPPAHLIDELDNQAPQADASPEEEVATLDFFGDTLPTWTHRLTYPFRWQGVPHTEVTVSQLTTAQVGAIFQRSRTAKRVPQLYEVYAAMTGLPETVLRALPAADGDPIIDKCFDFLPPSLRPEAG